MAATRGALIVLEGIDRTGKTTQSLQLVDFLNKHGHPAVHMRFPDRTTIIGKILGEYLTNARNVDDHAVHLLFAANRWEAKAQMEQYLREGKTVVVDRYAYSGAAFTTVKGIDLEWCKDPDRGLPAPDVVLYLKLSIEAAIKRGEFGNERYEKEDYQRAVKEVYENKLVDASFVDIDADQSLEAVQEDLRKAALTAIEEAAHKPILPLWTKDAPGKAPGARGTHRNHPNDLALSDIDEFV